MFLFGLYDSSHYLQNPLKIACTVFIILSDNIAIMYPTNPLSKEFWIYKTTGYWYILNFKNAYSHIFKSIIWILNE